MTKRRYLACDDTRCETVVSAAGSDETGAWVRLEETVFHPQGGGQKSDRGTIDGVPVSHVLSRDGEVFHYLAGPTDLAPGRRVVAEIDAALRRLHSRWHTAGHVLAALLEALFPGLTALAGHHWPGEGRVEAAGGTLPDPAEVQAKLDQAVCEAVAEDVPVQVVGDPYRSRAIQVGDGHRPVPCGGTHSRGTAELGVVRVRGVKAKGGKLRVSYDVEDPS